MMRMNEEEEFKVVVSCGSSGVFGLAKALTGGFLKETGVTLDLLESCQTFELHHRISQKKIVRITNSTKI